MPIGAIASFQFYQVRFKRMMHFANICRKISFNSIKYDLNYALEYFQGSGPQFQFYQVRFKLSRSSTDRSVTGVSILSSTI